MSLGLVGKKCGMTRVATEQGDLVSVTVVEVQANLITQVKTKETDGYFALQITAGHRRASHTNKPMTGHFAKAKVEAGRGLWEFRLNEQDLAAFKLGDEVKADLFAVGQYVDVQGVSRGKGFQGTIKRYHFAAQDATHGNSLSHRAPGSIGQRQTPGRVFKGKKMSGHMGQRVCSVLSQPIMQIDVTRNLLLIRGAIPGSPGDMVIVSPAVKKTKKEGTK